MQEGNSFARWNHSASIQGTLANTVRDVKKRKKAYTARDFHPHILYAEKCRRKREGIPEPGDYRAPVSILKSIFVDNAPIGRVLEEYGIESEE